ncbi:MAG: response regulator [Paenibacillaceae bacterium]
MGTPWKLLIADDEAIIRDGIRETIQWDQLSLVVVAEAEDGEEALEQALLHQVNIILVDLNMPIMNGLMVMKQIREQLPECRIVIITGHDEFTYAQEAIRLDVDDYILKPVNPAQLTEVLGKLSRQLTQQVVEDKYLTVASRQIEKNITILRERFCKEWLEGNLREEEVREQLEFLQLPLDDPTLLGVIRFEKDAGKPYITEKDRQLYLFAIENIAGEILQPWSHIIFRDHYGLIVIIIWAQVADEVLHSIMNAIREYLKITAYPSFEVIDEHQRGIVQSYNRAKENIYQLTQLSPMVRRGQQLIKEQYMNSELTLEMLADELQISPIYMSRQLKEELGTSFIQLLTQTRMNKAIYYLDSGDLSINEISELVGFDNQHYFSTSFKKNVGLSPNQYRRGNKLV